MTDSDNGSDGRFGQAGRALADDRWPEDPPLPLPCTGGDSVFNCFVPERLPGFPGEAGVERSRVRDGEMIFLFFREGRKAAP